MTGCDLIHDKFIKSVGFLFDDVIYVSENKEDGSIDFQYFTENFTGYFNDFEKIYISTDNIWFLGDSTGIIDIINRFENDKSFCSLWNRNDIFCNEVSSDIYVDDEESSNIPLFVFIDKHSDKLKSLESIFANKKNMQNSLKEILLLAEGCSFYYCWAQDYLGNLSDQPYMIAAIDSLNKGFPFIYLGIFKCKRSFLIKYGIDEQISLIARILLHDKQNAKLLIEFFKKECDPSFLKDILQLNYLPEDNCDRNIKYNFKIAVFAHLFYEEDFLFYLKYLSKASLYCDIYISVTDNRKKIEILNLADEKLKSKLKVFVTENRGRDISSLLVLFSSYVKDYDYYCFIHDKRSHDNEPVSVGKSFAKCLWDNLLPSDEAIPQIISIFENNPYLGLLVPPSPYWGPYSDIKYDMWTSCYEKAIMIANDLDIKVKISDKVNPVAIGTAFWSRKGVLDLLYSHSWQYDCFDEEPLPVDGTKSHALERLFPYIALESGFLTGWLLSKNNWSTVFESYVYLYENRLRCERIDPPIPYTIGKNANDIGVKGAIHILFQSVRLFFKSLGKFIKKLFRR